MTAPVQESWRPEVSAPPGAQVPRGYELPGVCWEQNAGRLGEDVVLLTTVSSLQPYFSLENPKNLEIPNEEPNHRQQLQLERQASLVSSNEISHLQSERFPKGCSELTSLDL